MATAAHIPVAHRAILNAPLKIFFIFYWLTVVLHDDFRETFPVEHDRFATWNPPVLLGITWNPRPEDSVFEIRTPLSVSYL